MFMFYMYNSTRKYKLQISLKLFTFNTLYIIVVQVWLIKCNKYFINTLIVIYYLYSRQTIVNSFSPNIP